MDQFRERAIKLADAIRKIQKKAAIIAKNITKEADAFIKANEPDYEKWYAGVTNNQDVRFANHKATDTDKNYWQCPSSKFAIDIEKHFELKGCDTGDKHNRNKDSDVFYVYLKTPKTKE